jgi:hypothetical protein
MAHTLTAEGGTNLAPSSAHTLAAEGGANLAPSAGHTLAAEGGANLAPSAGHTLAAEGGASLSPSAPGQISVEAATIPIGSCLLVTGSLMADAETPLTFPLLLPMSSTVEGRPGWSTTGGLPGAMVDGDRAVYFDATWKWLAVWKAGNALLGFSGGTTEMSPLLVATWNPLGDETGTPVFSLGDPKQLSAEGGANLAPSAGHTLTSEGGTNLAPSAGHTLTSEGGASLSPSAPPQLTAESSY